MASIKTEATELSLAFGLLGISDPLNVPQPRLNYLFEGTLSEQKYFEYSSSFQGELNLICKEMIDVGLDARRNHPHIKNYPTLKWTGPSNIFITTALAKDIQIGLIAVSAKAKSDVVSNNSPFNIIEAYPSSNVSLQERSPNWYLEVSREEFQEYYQKFREHCFPDQPESIEAFLKQTTKNERKELVRRAVFLDEERKSSLNELYLRMCHSVAKESSLRFNENMKRSMRGNSSQRIRVELVKAFFRISDSEYVLAGIDRGEKIALSFSNISSLISDFELVEIIAEPDLNAGQAVVRFVVTINSRKTNEIVNMPFHVELRWSHGKLCGNPEGKLYKDFAWKILPFVNNLLV